ncbi:MAG: hypothetical protein ACKV2U_33375 [Bryobacteraceae bacterium]
MPPRPSKNDWFYRRSAFPLRDAMPFELEAFWANRHKYARAADIHWQEAGPVNFAGRVTCLAQDAKDPNALYAGSAAGGLWHTANGGQSWRSVWPNALNQNIGAVAYDPSRPGHLICATGEGNLSSDAYPGGGIFCTTDNGLTWTPYYKVQGRIPRRVAAISITPTLVAFGAVSKDETLPAGLYLDSGASRYTFVTRWGGRSYDCHSVILHPTDSSVMYAAIEPRGTLNGIWRSMDGGQTWEQLHHPRGLPRPERCGRISLAIAPSEPRILYALAGNTNGDCFGVYRTEDGGDNWIKTVAGGLKGETNLAHNAAIAVHPADPDIVVCGAIRLHGSRDGGRSWEALTKGKSPTGYHAVLLSGPPNEPIIHAGHDSGVAVSSDGGRTWEGRSTGMATTMFYDLDVAPAASQVFAGGAQHIGALLHSGETPGQFSRVFAGDGGFVAFDAVDAKRVYGAGSDGRVFRHDPAEPYSSGWRFTRLPLSTGEKKLRSQFLFAVRPAHGERPQQRWFATSRLWFSSGERTRFTPVSPHFDLSAISALAFSPVDPEVILVGTSNGGIFRIRFIDDVWTWTLDLSTSIIPNRLITQIKFHPTQPNTVVLCVGSTNAPAADLTGTLTPYSHVFLSNDQGNTWVDIDLGELPNVVYNALTFEPHPPHRIFVGGDLGVWALDDDGWVNLTGNLPNVIISDLVHLAGDSILTAATFGRGIWRLPVPAGHPFRREDSSKC